MASDVQGETRVEWIGGILERIRAMECPVCGAPLASCAVRGIRTEPQAIVVKLACTVLDAHDFLQTWHGPVAELINTRRAERLVALLSSDRGCSQFS